MALNKIAMAMNNTESTEKFLFKIHNQIKNDIQKSSKRKSEEIKAKKLQVFLRQIKFLQNQYKNNNSINLEDPNFPFSNFWKKADQIALLNSFDSLKGSSVISGLNLINQPSDIVSLGSELEIGLSRVIKSFESVVTGHDYKESKSSIVGGAHTQIPNLINEADKDMKKMLADLYKETQKNLKAYKKDNSSTADYIHSVQGKIDNVGLRGNIILKSELTNMEKDLINILKEATFTDKNYLSTKELHFGQTNPFRVFMTVVPNKIDAIGRFSRMINCFEEHASTIHFNAPIYFYRIRAMYELTGIKMKYTNSTIDNWLSKNDQALIKIITGQYAKYLVWNTPYDDIYVIPTRSIVEDLIIDSQNMLPKDWKDALYGSISIKQKDLKNIIS